MKKKKTPEGDASTKVTKPSEKENEENPNSYANILKGSINNERNNRKGNDDQQNLILLTRTTRMSSEELFHQEGLSQPGIKISSLATIFLAIILVIKK
jgi:hypothetical protein